MKFGQKISSISHGEIVSIARADSKWVTIGVSAFHNAELIRIAA